MNLGATRNVENLALYVKDRFVNLRANLALYVKDRFVNSRENPSQERKVDAYQVSY